MIQITKQAIRRDEDGQRYLNCPCGRKVEVERPADYEILYVCHCGIEYDSHGYVQEGPMFEGNSIFEELTDLVERKLTEAKCL